MDVCDICGFEAKTVHELGAHRLLKHGVSGELTQEQGQSDSELSPQAIEHAVGYLCARIDDLERRQTELCETLAYLTGRSAKYLENAASVNEMVGRLAEMVGQSAGRLVEMADRFQWSVAQVQGHYHGSIDEALTCPECGPENTEALARLGWVKSDSGVGGAAGPEIPVEAVVFDANDKVLDDLDCYFGASDMVAGERIKLVEQYDGRMLVRVLRDEQDIAGYLAKVWPDYELTTGADGAIWVARSK